VPEGLEPGTPSSVGIMVLVMYLRFVHAISYQRLSRLLLELLVLAISRRALDAAFRRGNRHFNADVASILARLRRARVVCSDETSVRMAGRTAGTGCFRTARWWSMSSAAAAALASSERCWMGIGRRSGCLTSTARSGAMPRTGRFACSISCATAFMRSTPATPCSRWA